MTFREILEKLVEETPGAVAGAVMASDGIPVDEFQRDDADIDLAVVAVEFQRVLEQARKATGAVYGGGGGQLDEMILITGRHQLLFRQLDDEFFVTVALHPQGMLGKARYLVGCLLRELQEAL